MFIAVKKGKVVESGMTKSQLIKKLSKKKIRAEIQEVEDGFCPVCGNQFKYDKNGSKLVSMSQYTCFFCQGGIKI